MNIGIIGTGAYAISLSSLFENTKCNIMMWTKIESEYIELSNNYTNLIIINYKLNKKIKFTMSLEELVNHSDLLVLAIPAKFIASTISDLKIYYKNQEILIATKGMIESENCLINEYLEKTLKANKISCISGPSFAIDIIKKEPIGLTLSSSNKNSLNYVKKILQDISYLTIDETNDIIGTEICGLLKNIMAIGSGILHGMNINPSTICKFLKDASLEMQTIITNLGGYKETFLTYAGIGDYILTATSKNSRNYTFGFLIGSNDDFTSYMKNTTIEGLENLDGMYLMLKTKNIESKIINILYEIIYLKEDKNLLLNYLKNKE
ncbi:MAG: NAD(P)-binding domain-containing protein [Bacilli bacterium]|nr:NAD(P)-binding domain-containing protein [Bacilli bacterium]